MPPSRAPGWSGAKRIIAVDTDNKKLDWAREFGATHTINARELDPVETIQDLTDGNGADVVIDAVGRPETWKQAFYARDLAGTVVLVGVPTPDMTLEMPLVDFFSRGGSLKSSWYGDCLPERDFPTLISLYLQGRLPLEKFVSERIGLDDVEEAFHKMHAGEVLRSVVVLMRRPDRSASSPTAPSNSTAAVGKSTTTSGSSATTPRSWCSTPPTTPAHHRGRRRTPCGGGGVHARPQRPCDRRPRTRRGAGRPGAAAPGRRRAVANDASGQGLPHRQATARRYGSPGHELRALHTPGHSPGSVCWYAPELNAVFSGDTLFEGGPGATGRSYSDFPTILDVHLRAGSAPLPGETIVYTGHGDTTTIGDEIVHYDEWVARGH